MRVSTVVIAVLALAAGFAAGFLTRDRKGPAESAPAPAAASAVEDARAALGELMNWHGVGARGTRGAMDLVARIVAGGEEVLPAVAKALREGKDWKYDQLGLAYSFDWRAGVVSQYPNRRVALLEAAHKIGGAEAEKLLMERVEKGESYTNRVAALSFLAQRANRAEVAGFITDRILLFLRDHRDDPEMGISLKIARGRLLPRAYDALASAVAAGWARVVIDDLAAAFYFLDPARAEKHFRNILAKPEQPLMARLLAARALGRLPAMRPDAAAILAETGPDMLINEFVKSMRHGRFDEPYLELEARMADRQTQKEYIETRIKHLRQARDLVESLAAKMGPERSKKLGLEDALQAYDRIIREAEQKLNGMRPPQPPPTPQKESDEQHKGK